MKRKQIVLGFFLSLWGGVILGLVNGEPAGQAADPCQAIVDAHRSAVSGLSKATEDFNRVSEPDQNVRAKWRDKVLPADFGAAAARKKPEKDALENKCQSGQATTDEKQKLDALKIDITELEALAGFQTVFDNLQDARTQLAQAEPPYRKLIGDKTKAMNSAEAAVANEKKWLGQEKTRTGYETITDKAQKLQARRAMATHVVDALKPVKAGLDGFDCLPDVAKFLDKLQKNILKYEGLRAGIPSDLGEDLSDLSLDLDLTDVTVGADSFANLPVATRAALAIAACAYPKEKAPTLYPDQPGFNPSLAPRYLKTYQPGQYYSVSLSEGGSIIEIAIFQHAGEAASQNRFAAWQNTGDPQNPALPVAWSAQDVPAFKKRPGLLDVAMEGTDDIVVRGRAGVWHFEVAVLANQMGLSPGKASAPKEDTARQFFLRLIENARYYRLFP